MAQSEADRRRLEEENRRLATELALLRSRTARAERPASDDRLLAAGCVPARVLGRQARDFLVSEGILDIGSRDGVRKGAMVIGAPKSLLDQGANRRLESEELVLAQGRVWGKIVEVGPQTSTVRTPCEPGFRDLVRLGVPSADGRTPRLGPQGLLEGTGEPLARVQGVDVTEPVAVGDAVYTASGQGVLPQPLLYGFVVRVQRPVGAAHWDIWMKPALDSEPESVVVLRTQINPARVIRSADQPGEDRPMKLCLLLLPLLYAAAAIQTSLGDLMAWAGPSRTCWPWRPSPGCWRWPDLGPSSWPGRLACWKTCWPPAA